MEPHTGNGEIVLFSRSLPRCREYLLVLQAAGIECAVERAPHGFVIVVPPDDATRARAELAAYRSEQRDALPDAAALPKHSGGWIGVIAYTATLLLVAVLADRNAWHADWFAAGNAHASLIRHGEWWRTITALTLHADVVHLTGNLVIGGLVGLYAGQLLGPGLAWLGVLSSGAAGNLLNAYVHGPDRTSIGASTAVFAALGLIAAYGQSRRQPDRPSVLARFAPVIGAVVLLSLLGTGGGRTGGGRTDVSAHVCGFACGLALGMIYGALGRQAWFARRAQLYFGSLALAAVAAAWTVALR